MARSRSLLPREHGAYAELLFPLMTGLALSRPSLAALLLTLAAIAFFLAHEPIAILIGARGAQARDTWGDRALKRAIVLVAIAMISGGVAVTLATPTVRWAIGLPAGLALLLFPSVAAGKIKTLVGEILVVATFCSTLIPGAVLSGVQWWRAWSSSGVWFWNFVLGTLAVHAIKARANKRRSGRWPLATAPLLAALTCGGAMWTAITEVAPPALALALTPTALVTIVESIVRIHPRQLKTVGWSLVSANVLTAVLLIVS